MALVIASQEKQEFPPIMLTVTLFNPQELHAVYELCNYARGAACYVRDHSDKDFNVETLNDILSGIYEQLSAYHSRHC